MDESFYLNYQFRGRLESNAEDPQEAWACKRCGVLVQTQDGEAHCQWHLETSGPGSGAHPAVIASDLDRLRTAVRAYLDALRVGHKGGSELARMRVLADES
jgi:hypothetical protein